MQTFYIYLEDGEYGPYPQAELMTFYKEGIIQDQTPCRNEWMAEYLPFHLVRQASIDKKTNRLSPAGKVFSIFLLMLLLWGGYHWYSEMPARQYIDFFEKKALTETDKDKADRYRKLGQSIRQAQAGAKIDTLSVDKNTPLLVTVASWQASDLISYLLKRGASPNVDDAQNRTALRVSARKGIIQSVKALTDQSAEVNVKDNSGRTALMGAAWMEHLNVVDLLLKKGADINILDDKGRSALSWAAENGNPKMVDLLLSNGATINEDALWERPSPIRQAAEYGNMEALEKLLDQIKKPELLTPLLSFSINKGNINLAQLTLKKGAPLTPEIWHKVLTKDNREMVRLFIKQGANLSSLTPFSNRTPLEITAENSQPGNMEELLAQGAKPGQKTLLAAILGGRVKNASILVAKGITPEFSETEGNSLLLRCIKKNNSSDMVKFLLDNGAKVESKNIQDETPLMIALYMGNTNTVLHLLNKGANVNTKDNNEVSVLMIAAYTGNTDSFTNVLNKYKGDINQKDNFGRTALRWAAKGGNLAIVELLLAKGASCNLADAAGETPLMSAAHRGEIKMTKCLLEKGKAKINACGDDGRTALIWALKNRSYRNNSANMVRLLVEKGANINAKAKNEETPLSFAMKENKQDIINYLIDKGADLPNISGNNISLLAAIYEGDLIKVKILLKKGANANEKGADGDTPLIAAVYRGQKEAVIELIKHKANVNALKHSDGATPLGVAKGRGYTEIARILEEYGAK